MKRFMLFAGHCADLRGGMGDYQGRFISEDAAIAAFDKLYFNSYIDHCGHIYDLVSEQVTVQLTQSSKTISGRERYPVVIVPIGKSPEDYAKDYV